MKTRKIKRHVLRFGLLCLFVISLTGCSTFGFLFERLDWLAMWKLDQMFDLTAEQEEQLRPKIQDVHQWLKQEGLPLTINVLYEVREKWENGELVQTQQLIESSVQSLAQEFMKAAVPAIETLSENLTEENAKHYRDYCKDKYGDWFSGTKSDEGKLDRTVERLEDWFGDLTDGQMLMVTGWAKVVPREYSIRVENNEAWVNGFISASLNKDKALIRQWAEDPAIFWTEDYRQLHNHYQQQRLALVQWLFPILTTKQRQHATDRVDDWIGKLEGVLN